VVALAGFSDFVENDSCCLEGLWRGLICEVRVSLKKKNCSQLICFCKHREKYSRAQYALTF
jgi:hypothetical protein